MNKHQYTRLNITLPSDLLEKFSEYCKKEGMMLSSRIAALIEKDLEKYKGEWLWDKWDEIKKIDFVKRKLAEAANYDESTGSMVKELEKINPKSKDYRIYSEILHYIKKLKKK